MNGKIFAAAFIGIIALAVVALIALRRTVPPPLRFDDRMLAVFTGASRVETFRLADLPESAAWTPEERALLDDPKRGLLNTHTILRPGKRQDHAFAIRLANALEQTRDTSHQAQVDCFDPGVGFRVWKDKDQERAEIALCFSCSGAEVILEDAHGNAIKTKTSELGHARAALLKLCKEAFPGDKQLQAIKE